jgi:hypothetical protein
MKFVEDKLKLLNQLPEPSIYIHWNPDSQAYYVGIEGVEIESWDGSEVLHARADAITIDEAFSMLWGQLTQPNKKIRHTELGTGDVSGFYRWHDGRFQLLESA